MADHKQPACVRDAIRKVNSWPRRDQLILGPTPARVAKHAVKEEKMALPKNIQRSVKVLTADPKVKAACDIEEYLKSVRAKCDEAQKKIGDLPNLYRMGEKYVRETWIPLWRSHPMLGKEESGPLPADWGVYMQRMTLSEKGQMCVDLHVHYPVNAGSILIPKKLHKAARAADRCRSEKKRKVMRDDVSRLIAKEFKLPEADFLLPNWEGNPKAMHWFIAAELPCFDVPYTTEMVKLKKTQEKYRAESKRAQDKLNEFYKLLPTPVREMLDHMQYPLYGFNTSPYFLVRPR